MAKRELTAEQKEAQQARERDLQMTIRDLTFQYNNMGRETSRLAKDKLDLKDELSKAKRRIRDLEYARNRKRAKPIPIQAVAAVEQLPEWLQDTAKEIVTDNSMRDVVTDVLDRRSEFKAEHIALLAGIGMNMKAREHFDRMLDKEWAKPQANIIGRQEVIVGGGLHAAIYSAVRVKMGKPRPLVIERSTHPGGAFACSRGPAFYLNSRNRPGDAPSIPGDGKALNYLPGCDLQPADMGGGEYQSNDLIAWVVRCNLALYADVWSGKNVTQIAGRTLYGGRGQQIASTYKRIIVAVGSGPESGLGFRNGERLKNVVGFSEFMGMMDKPFPMRGMKRIAVIGAGDAGKTVIEALTGQGPPMVTINSLDYPEIHWYGVPAGQRNRAEWENCNRSRYKGIGRLLVIPGQTDRVRRVKLCGSGDFYRASSIEPGIDCAYVDGKPYDLVVECTGFQQNEFRTDGYSSYNPLNQGSSIAGQNGAATYTIGTCAYLNPSSEERNTFKQVGENATSIFFLARKTEALAMYLD